VGGTFVFKNLFFAPIGARPFVAGLVFCWVLVKERYAEVEAVSRGGGRGSAAVYGGGGLVCCREGKRNK